MDIDDNKQFVSVIIEDKQIEPILSPIIKATKDCNDRVDSNSVDQIKQFINPISDDNNNEAAILVEDKENNLNNESEEISEGSEIDKEDLAEPEHKLKKLDFIYTKHFDTIQPYENNNYLLNYCIDLFKQGYYDPKIATWMIENKSLLEKEGITEQYLKWILKQDKYYKGTNIINSMTYRITKFGKLAPQSDLVRKLNEGDNEENFKYYEEDSFIAIDEEDEIKNDNYLLKGMSGFIKDVELIDKLKKARKRENTKKNKSKQLDKKLLGNKRNMNEASQLETQSIIVNDPVKIYTSLEDFLCERERKLFELADNKKAKGMFIRDIIFAQRRKKKSDKNEKTEKVEKNFTVDLEILSKAIKEDAKICKLLFEFEERKYFKENKWSSLYKALHKFTKDFLLKIKNDNTNQKENKESTCVVIEQNLPKEENEAVNDYSFSSNKIIDKIEGIKLKTTDFNKAYAEMISLIKDNADILKEYYLPVTLEFQDPSEFCKNKINTLFSSLSLSHESQINFWEIYLEINQSTRTNASQKPALNILNMTEVIADTLNQTDNLTKLPELIKEENLINNISAFDIIDKEKSNNEDICSPKQIFDLTLKEDNLILSDQQVQAQSKLNTIKKEKKAVIPKKPFSSKYFRKKE